MPITDLKFFQTKDQTELNLFLHNVTEIMTSQPFVDFFYAAAGVNNDALPIYNKISVVPSMTRFYTDEARIFIFPSVKFVLDMLIRIEKPFSTLFIFIFLA